MPSNKNTVERALRALIAHPPASPSGINAVYARARWRRMRRVTSFALVSMVAVGIVVAGIVAMREGSSDTETVAASGVTQIEPDTDKPITDEPIGDEPSTDASSSDEPNEDEPSSSAGDPEPETSSEAPALPVLVRSGSRPDAILAVNSTGQVVSISASTGEATVLWDGAELPSSTPESTDSFIESVAVAGSSHVLVGVCCEPATGQIWLLDLDSTAAPRRLLLDGSHPSVSPGGTVAVSDGVGVKGLPLTDILSGSDRLVSASYFGGLGGADADVAWIGDEIVVFDRRREGASDIVAVDVRTGTASERSGGIGWERPSGNSSGGVFVVVEQCCWDPINRTIAETSTLLAVDGTSSESAIVATLAGGVESTDVDRGWLLVTRSGGEVGTINPEDGSFTAIAADVRTAVWFE